ncbi:putative ABC transport system permease protein [Parabacteroides sp. PFB2-12]|uniref:ABC transporter permease n=1 Tax=unclassified Parabacteroides TaxID=2649774 RepID=UPI002474BDC8|nr:MULTISPECIES: ABC transporter permease [unclassified Parabacteroides]MDH6342697.1 putative ABC transport system permease protein [Parabacteroides sp. PM6-13]MDH6389760.1 putative ABC transport system permease protein [Parabacteroides sp. PFB2-12]
MKQFFYTLRYLVYRKGSNSIKVISLTLGLAVALVLFSKVAFELSYDRFYPDADRIYRIQRLIYSGETTAYDGPVVFGPVATAMKNDLAEVEEMVTTSRIPTTEEIYIHEENRFRIKRMSVQSSFFDVFGIKLLQGHADDLNVNSHIFLSESLARRVFGEEDPMGKPFLRKGSEKPLLVAGVYTDLPANSHLTMDAVTGFGYDPAEMPWLGRDSFLGYVKLRPGVSAEEVEAKIPAMLTKYYDVEAEKAKGNDIHYVLKPVTQLHSHDDTVRRLLTVLSVLAFSLLFISAMNYLLVSLSSLMVRAKSVGIYKCSGATNRNVFSMFFFETLGLILISVGLAVFLIFLFKVPIENMIQTSLKNVFMYNIWVPLSVIGVLLLCTGIVPAVVFSRIPVSQVFRSYSLHKNRWKSSLLFTQFAGIAFVCTLLFVIVRQYDLLMNKDMGYSMEHVYFTEDMSGQSGEQYKVIKSELENMAQVKSVSVATNLPLDFMNGDIIVIPESNEQFSTRFMAADKDYLHTFGIQMAQGRAFTEENTQSSTILVNEKFASIMGWGESPIGRRLKTFMSNEPMEVIGVVKDFQLMALFKQESEMLKDIPPLVIFPMNPTEDVWWARKRIVVKLHEASAPVVAQLNKRLTSIAQDEDAYFMSYVDKMELSYIEARMFRKAVMIAALIMLLITFIGLYGYTDDEVNRRSKEIAIRKIVGASARDVLYTINKGVLIISVPALVIGLFISHIVGSSWLQQFAVKIALDAPLFIFSSMLVLGGIILCITVRTWRVANENPVNHLRTE